MKRRRPINARANKAQAWRNPSADTKRIGKIPIALCCALFVSGCVGGPGSYFESVSREKATVEQSQSATLEQPDLEIASVESSELDQVDPGTTTVEAPNGTDQPVLVTGNEIQSAGMAPLSDGSIQPFAPLQIGLIQKNDGEVLLLPRTEETPADLSGANAYAATPNSTTSNPSSLAAVDTGDNMITGDEGNSFAIGSETPVYIDPIEAAALARIPLLSASIRHGKCGNGFGPKPRKLGAKRINSGDPFYIEIRMRQTPLLPVGHTYVAYGRLGADGEPLDENLIMLAPAGGYAGAALASGIPMPGILTPHRDDCRIRPDIGYRVSLNAQRYEKLLMEVRKAKAEKPSYLLLAYNCNHFMTRIAGSVGILPPNNIYLPAVQYLHAMIERNEGIKVSRW